MNIVLRKLNGAMRRWRRLEARRAAVKKDGNDGIAIYKPIFILGPEGGGLTLLSAMLHRSPSVVYITGNYKKWAGEDEMCSILEGFLPEGIDWGKIPNSRFHHRLGRQYGSLYATDELLPYFKKTAEDCNSKTKENFIRILKNIIKLRKGKTTQEPARFVDKSQLFSVKIGLINEILRPYHPKFVLIARNPYAWCWRASVGYPRAYDKPALSQKEWLELACQQWNNIMNTILEEKNAEVRAWRFGDILNSPRETLREICAFAELEYSDDMLPQKNQKIPFGSNHHAFIDKWYPIRADVNVKYLREIPDWGIEIISEKCRALIDKLGYKFKRP